MVTQEFIVVVRAIVVGMANVVMVASQGVAVRRFS